MMFRLFIFSSLCLVTASSRAQQIQQPDSNQPPYAWVRASTPSNLSIGLTYFSADTCWGGDSKSAMISTDGGMNWSYTPRTGIMRNAHEGYQFNENSKATYRTTDGWRTWETLPFPEINAFVSACIVDSLHIYVCGGNNIGRSTNAGKTWEVTTTPGFIGFISFSDVEHGYVIGGDPSYCFKTIDTGHLRT